MTVIDGPNGSGKTSIIEAIYIALTGKSWRSNLAEILRFDGQETASWWRLDLIMADGNKRVVKYDGQKSFTINGQVSRRLTAKNKLPVVLFEPSDLQLLYGSPSRRRDFFDRFLVQLQPEYQTNLNKFNRILRQRNNLLKQTAPSSELFIWDLQFADLSAKIAQNRLDLVKTLNQNLIKHYQLIAGKTSQLEIKFLPGGPTEKSAIFSSLKNSSTTLLQTPIGAQKDDFSFILNHKNAKTNASRGENRTIIFAILAEQIEILKTKHQTVYVILDDIDSELDSTRKTNLYNLAALAENNLFATTIKFDGQATNHIRLT
jgi:DNA replication and repair protein RecF